MSAIGYKGKIYGANPALNDVVDVDITSPSNGDVLKYNSADSEWENSALTKSDVGLSNVPNVTTDNQTPTVSEASTRTNLASGDTLSTIIGKIKKYFTDLKTVAFTGAYADLSGTPTIPDVSTKYDSSDTAETTLADDDKMPFYDTSASGKRNSTWANIKAKLKTYFDGIYAADTTKNITYPTGYNDSQNAPYQFASESGVQGKVTNVLDYIQVIATGLKTAINSHGARIAYFDNNMAAKADTKGGYNNPNYDDDSHTFNIEVIESDKSAVYMATTNESRYVEAVNDHAAWINGLTTETDTTESKPYLYRPTHGTGDRVYEKLIGCSFGVNQLVQNGDFANGETNWSFASVTSHSVSNGVETFTASAQYGRMYQSLGTKKLIKDHVFLFSADLKIASGTRRIQMCISDAVVGTQTILKTINSNWVRYYWLAKVTYTFTGTESIFIRDYESSNFVGISVKKVNYTDLTLMFGTDIADKAYALETATAGSGIAWLQSYGFFIKDYYSYNAGSLVSVKPTAHKLVGKNLCPMITTPQTVDGVVYTPQSDGSVRLTGKSTGQSAMYLLTSTTAPNLYRRAGTYKASAGSESSTNARMCISVYRTSGTTNYYDVDTSNEEVTFTVNEGDTFNVYLRTNGGNVAINATLYPMLRFASVTDNTFEPYTEHTYPLSTELRGVAQLSGNDIVYDGDENDGSGSTVRKYGIVDLGSLSWFRDTSTATPVFYINRNNIGAKQNSVNVVCPKYTAKANFWDTAGNDKCIAMGTNALNISDSAYTDPAAFKTAMSGVYLVYELATPTIEPSTPFDNPQICDPDGTEEYIDTRDVPIPVGHTTKYVNLPDWMEEGYVADLRNRVDEHIGSDGNFNGNALTATLATKATQDGDGNTISSTYLKLSGGTMTGKLITYGTSVGLVSIEPVEDRTQYIGSWDKMYRQMYISDELSIGKTNWSRGVLSLRCSDGRNINITTPISMTYSRAIQFPDADGTVALSTSSSRKVKKNISDMTGEEAEKLFKLRPVNYDYIDDSQGTNCYGFIAEEVEEIGITDPIINTFYPNIEEEVLGLDYAKFVPYLVKVVQMQQKQIDMLKSKML